MNKPCHSSSSPYIHIYNAKIGLRPLKPRICMFTTVFHWQYILCVGALCKLTANTLLLDIKISQKSLHNRHLHIHDDDDRLLLPHLCHHCQIISILKGNTSLRWIRKGRVVTVTSRTLSHGDFSV